MTRIFINQPLSVGARLTLPEAAARHLVQVLRHGAGDSFIAFNGMAGEYTARLESVGKREALAHIESFDAVDRESPLQLTLVQCVSKGDRMDYTLQKAVELGVTRIVPLLSERSVVKLDAERWEKKMEHWQGVVISACEQSGRTRVPALDLPQKLLNGLPQSEGLKLVLAPGRGMSLRRLPASKAVTLLVGPEGGLSASEITYAQQQGYTGLTLGPRILRTETAGVAALAALQSHWGDWE